MKKWLTEQFIGFLLMLGFFSWLLSMMSMIQTFDDIKGWQFTWWVVSIIFMCVVGIIYEEVINKDSTDKYDQAMEAMPPTGIIPEWLHREHRIADLKAAVKRYVDDDRYEECVINWMIEIRELESEVNQ